jgi:hypothetical protein
MRTIMTTLLGLSVLAGVSGSASAGGLQGHGLERETARPTTRSSCPDGKTVGSLSFSTTV